MSTGCVVVQAALKSGAAITANCALEQGRQVFAVPGPIDDPLSAGCHALISQGARLTGSSADIFDELGQTYDRADLGGLDVQLTLNDPIVAACQVPISWTDLANQSGMTDQELHSRLFELQLEGKIRQNYAGMWERA